MPNGNLTKYMYKYGLVMKTDMKSGFLKIALRIVVFLFKYFVNKWSNKTTTTDNTQYEYIQDVRINKETADMFAKYIKSHTEKKQRGK